MRMTATAERQKDFMPGAGGMMAGEGSGSAAGGESGESGTGKGKNGLIVEERGRGVKTNWRRMGLRKSGAWRRWRA
jgi:hypothetical protein